MTPQMNILAIYPERLEQRTFDPMPPLGLAWIAAVVRSHRYHVRIVDEQVEKTDFERLMYELSPSIVLIGGTSHSRFDAFSRAAQAKAAVPEATVVYGGPHASFTAENTLSNVPDIDIVVHGEGEYTVLDIIRWKEAGGRPDRLEKIKGIAYRVNGGVVSTGWRPFNRELDKLPPPARDLLPIERYDMRLEYLNLPAMHIMTARGCPFNCSFCSASQMYANSYAMRSPKLVIDEVEDLVKRYHIKGVKIFDSTFTINKNHVRSFCRELTERGMVMPWECEVRVGSVDKRLLEEMQNAGCYYLDIGIESADQEVLDVMKKKIRISDAEQLLRWCEELGLRTKVFFTVGHINETYSAGLKTIRFIRQNLKRITLVGYNPGIRIYPGTMVEEHARKNNLYPDGFNWSKPYENLDNLKIYLSANNIPLLLQPRMGIKELRRLRHRYILTRITSPAFLLFKAKTLLKHGEVRKYIGLGLGGMIWKKIRARSTN